MEIASMIAGEGEGGVKSRPGGIESGGTELMLCVKFLFSEHQLCTFHGEEFCPISFSITMKLQISIFSTVGGCLIWPVHTLKGYAIAM